MADNRTTLADQDGQFSDWIEVHNPGPGPLDLGGHCLTDERDRPAKWRFPAGVVVPEGGFRIVFASGKDRAGATDELHTNFQLDKDGEYLALVAPDGLTVLQAFDPYPPQTEDISFGPGRVVEGRPLVTTNTLLRVLVPSDDAFGMSWTGEEEPFDDTAWLGGVNGLGYDTAPDANGEPNLFGPLIRTDLRAAMFGVNASAYVRMPFVMSEAPPPFSRLTLRAHWDDGFVAYLNGAEVIGRNAPVVLSWDSAAITNRADALAIEPEVIDLTPAARLLRRGTNLLAFHALNSAPDARRFLLAAELEGAVEWQTNLFFTAATPGASNAPGRLPTLPPVEFSVGSRLFTNTLTLALSQPVPGADIFFSRDGSVPTPATGILYEGPLTLTNSTQIRAVAFRFGYSPGPVKSEHYVQLGSDLAGFTSPLPLLVLHNFGAGPVPGISGRGPNGDGSQVVQVPLQPHALIVLDRDPAGQARLTNPPAAVTRAGLRVHGSSAFNNTKKSYTLETWGETNQSDRDVALLGLPAESDWVLYGPSWRFPSGGADYDAALIHNSFIYELANASGYYAPRTRFVEVFLNTNGGPVTFADYAGLYVLTEKIKRAPGRVDFPPLSADGTRGGWMISADRMDALPPGAAPGSLTPRHFHTAGPDGLLQTPDDNARGFKGLRPTVSGGVVSDTHGLPPPRDDLPNYYHSFFNFESPSGWEITLSQRAAIETFMRAFDAALYGPNYTDPAAGYRAFIDVDNWVHHFILQNFPKNQDAEVLSAYFVRDGPAAKLKHGPIWDFDRAYNKSPANPNPAADLEWVRPRLFYLRLFTDPEFKQAYIDKWQRLRRGAFSDSNLLAIVDRQTNEITGLVPQREGMFDWPARIGAFKQWLTNRAAAIDAQFLKMPVFNPDGGAVPNGFTLWLTNPNPTGALFFTLDGSDPRAAGGGVAAGAQVWPQSVVLNAPTVIRARVQSGTNWSGLAGAVFYTPQDFRGLALTEIMFHPPDVGATNGDAFEFLELKNTGATPLDLTGLNFTAGITFAFPFGTVLAPGAFCVLVRDTNAFAARYPGVPWNGVYAGRLADGGETLTLSTGLGTPVFSLTYDDDAPWPVAADGHGFSLVPKNPGRAQAPDDGAQWRASAMAGGSPGADDPVPAISGVVINEVLTHPTAAGASGGFWPEAPGYPTQDAIELFNPTDTPADLSGWFLSNEAGVLKKFRIPDGTVLGPGGFVTFSELDFNPTSGTDLGFSLSPLGDSVYLCSADTNGNLTGYSHGVAVGGAARGVSFGRHVNSAGQEQFPPQIALSLGGTNSGPRVGPVVLSEIMYHPPSGGVEFIEVANVSDAPVPLFDRDRPANTWRISGAAFSFPTNVVLPPRGLALVVGTDERSFRALHSVPVGVPVFGPFGGALQDSGERLRLERPEAPAPGGAVPFNVVDAVRYNDKAPWPAAADGAGAALHRLTLSAYGDEPTNWIALTPSPGRALDSDGDGPPDWWEQTHGLDAHDATDAHLDLDGDGQANGQEFVAGTDPRSRTSVLRLELTCGGISNQVRLAFQAVPGRSYTLQGAGSLTDTAWTNLWQWESVSDTQVLEWLDVLNAPQWFFRLMVSGPSP